jgi:hypothetical protein
VKILIGIDTPEAHCPLEVSRGEGREPYALRGVLGWTIYGPFGRTTPSRKSFYHIQTSTQHPDEDDNGEGPIEVRKKLVHSFGARPSPTISNSTFPKTADDDTEDCSAEVIKVVRENLYVDDVAASKNAVKKGVELDTTLPAMLEDGGFGITKFVTNGLEVLAAVPPEDRPPSVEGLDFNDYLSSACVSGFPVERSLGVHWNTESDQLRCGVVSSCDTSTKRNIFRVVARAFNPLGVFSLFLLNARRIFQELCERKSGWYQTFNGELYERWKDWLKGFEDLTNLRFNEDLTNLRFNGCFQPPGFGKIKDPWAGSSSNDSVSVGNYSNRNDSSLPIVQRGHWGPSDPIKILFSQFLEWLRLCKSVAWLMGLQRTFRQKPLAQGPLLCVNMKTATMKVVKLVRKEAFHKELQFLAEENMKPENVLKSRRKSVPSSVKKLSPILVNGVLRVDGRLEFAFIGRKCQCAFIGRKCQCAFIGRKCQFAFIGRKCQFALSAENAL